MSRLLEAPPARRPPPARGGSRRSFRRLLAALLLVTMGVVVWRSGVFGSSPSADRRASDGTVPSGAPAGGGTASSPRTQPTAGPINTKFPGLTTFRGNASRSWYGEGPVPTNPVVLWRYPSSGGMCSQSVNLGETRTWCGTGWTGQPNVIQNPDGRVEIRFGAYDGHYHFLNGATGEQVRPDLVTGDLAKGSATTDPEGFPLYYAGSRDNFLRVVALDRSKPKVLWRFDSNSQPGKVWNDDWDGAPLVVGDYLLEGGENSWFYVIKLNRRYDSRHKVQVDPHVVMRVPGFDDELMADLNDEDVSIENSVAYDAKRGVAYFANSGGLVQGWDISDVLAGGTHFQRVFRFWDGDETDASVVIDPEGYLYVARHASFNVQTRSQARDHQVGSLMKLNPRKPSDPIVWDTQIGGFEPDGGILSTPALAHGNVYVMDTAGALVAVKQSTGKVRYRVPLPGPTWMSPVPIGDTLLVGDCSGILHAFDITKAAKKPHELWTMQLSGCIESTPAVWHGMIWVGARGGAMYGIGNAS
jgi:outer membrane protein assembly factor BamB